MGRPRSPEYRWVAPVVAALRRRRIALEMTQQQVADAAGVKVQYVCRIETGATVPGVASMDRLLAAVGLRLDVSEVDS